MLISTHHTQRCHRIPNKALGRHLSGPEGRQNNLWREERSDACYSRARAPGTGNEANTIALGEYSRKMDKERRKKKKEGEEEGEGECQERKEKQTEQMFLGGGGGGLMVRGQRLYHGGGEWLSPLG